MKVAITGVAGFVGSNLADSLLLKNHEVVGVDNFSTGHKNHILHHKENKNFTMHKLDLSTEFDKAIFSDCDAVIHFFGAGILKIFYFANQDPTVNYSFDGKIIHHSFQ